MAASTHDNPDVSIEKPRPTLEELKERKRKSRQPVGGCRETITVSMGPQHPSTHGVFRAELDLDGEIIVNARPEIGNMNRGGETHGCGCPASRPLYQDTSPRTYAHSQPPVVVGRPRDGFGRSDILSHHVP